MGCPMKKESENQSRARARLLDLKSVTLLEAEAAAKLLLRAILQQEKPIIGMKASRRDSSGARSLHSLGAGSPGPSQSSPWAF